MALPAENLINESDRVFSFLRKGYFPTAILFSKLDVYLKTIKKSECFVIAARSVLNQRREEIEKILAFKEDDIYCPDGETSDSDVTACLAKINSRKKNSAFIFALGGGSVIDLAKLMKYNTGRKLIAVPTTPSTGSEVTPFSVIIDKENIKKVIVSHRLLPDVVVLDPSLLLTIESKQLGYMIYDILGHGIEGLFSRFSNNFSDILAMDSVRLVFNNINQDVEKEDFLKNIQLAGLLAGFAQGIASTGLCHALAHYFGPKFSIPHSRAVSVFLRDVTELNVNNSSLQEKFEVLNKSINGELLEELEALPDKLGLTIEKISVGNDFDIATSIEQVKQDVCIMSNPFRPTEKQIESIIKAHTIIN